MYVFYCPEFSGQEIRSTVIFNPVEQSSVALEDEEDSELKGPVVRRQCVLQLTPLCDGNNGTLC